MSDLAFQSPEDRYGLPGWTYFNDELFALETEELFHRHWQLVCHVSDIPAPGHYTTYDIVGERALIIRGDDGVVRAFHNLCRHRGSRVVSDEQGVCPRVITCPFHGWSFNLDGTLRGVAKPRSLPRLDPVEWGLKPIELEIWQGFVFIRFKPGRQPSIAEIMAPHMEMVSKHKLEELEPVDRPVCSDVWQVNWKAIRDVDNEGYHVPKAHPGLHDLYGKDYSDHPIEGDTSISIGVFNETPATLWSVRVYRELVSRLPSPWSDLPGQWTYLFLFPNQVFGLYPDSVIFYQDIPVATGASRQRSAAYSRLNEDRVTRLARRMAARIDEITADEDMQLIEWSYEAMKSSAFDGILLSEIEAGVGRFHHRMKELFPVMRLPDEPERGEVQGRNDDLKRLAPNQ